MAVIRPTLTLLCSRATIAAVAVFWLMSPAQIQALIHDAVLNFEASYSQVLAGSHVYYYCES